MLHIVLASRSPARKILMKKLSREIGFLFETCVSNYHENMLAYRSSWRLAKFLALGKARYVIQTFPKKFTDSLVIGADTFITCDGKKIGKPKSITDAKRLIRFMSGRVISVYSGVAVVQTNAQCEIVKEVSRYALTKLHIKSMNSREVDLLAHQKNALNISGAFSIEGEGGKMITKIEGDYDNVIGLPLFLLKKMLSIFGIKTRVR